MSQSITKFLTLFRTQSHSAFGGTIDLTIATPRNCNTPTLDQRGESKTSNTPTPTNKVAATPRSNASVLGVVVRKKENSMYYFYKTIEVVTGLTFIAATLLTTYAIGFAPTLYWAGVFTVVATAAFVAACYAGRKAESLN